MYMYICIQTDRQTCIFTNEHLQFAMHILAENMSRMYLYHVHAPFIQAYSSQAPQMHTYWDQMAICNPRTWSRSRCMYLCTQYRSTYVHSTVCMHVRMYVLMYTRYGQYVQYLQCVQYDSMYRPHSMYSMYSMYVSTVQLLQYARYAKFYVCTWYLVHSK